MDIFNRILEQAKSATNDRIVLPEGTDERVIEAAQRLQANQIATPILLGDKAEVNAKADSLGIDLSGVEMTNPAESDLQDELGKLLLELRQHKGMTAEQADTLSKDPLCFANLMVKAGHADGCVAGSVYTTADVVRTAIQVLGVKEGCKTISSFFLMIMDKPHHPIQGGVLFTDCALVVDPRADQLAEIAMSAAENAKSILMEDPRVAMLSFSTSGSAKHDNVQKVIDATATVQNQMPDLAIDGDVQFDAALIPAISKKKVKDSSIHGQANVLVFPSLNAGNIGYKIAERIGGAKAIGPVMQGLSKPANDLSRGCSAEDVYNTAAVTVMQANS